MLLYEWSKQPTPRSTRLNSILALVRRRSESASAFRGFERGESQSFPLLWCYFERGDHLDVVRLLGERQDIAAILGDEYAAN